MKPTISFGILACNEYIELDTLLEHLTNCIINTDNEIVIVTDKDNTSKEVNDVIDKYIRKSYDNGVTYLIHYYSQSLNKDFSQQRNYLNCLCNGDYIFQIDSDEMISKEFIDYLPTMLEANLNVDVFDVPRINIVKHLELDDVVRWGWHISKHDKYIVTDNINNLYPKELELLKVYNLIINAFYDEITYSIPVINFPDNQKRLFKNKPEIKWKNKVHETLSGYETHTQLPTDDLFCLTHIKSIERQRKQNDFYTQIN
jgi:hypothetical protein